MIDHETAVALCNAFGVTLNPNSEDETFLCRLANNQALWLVPSGAVYLLLTDI